MNKLKNMRLSTMLGAGFALVIAIGFFVALFARMQLVSVGNNLNYAANVRLVNLLLIVKIKDNITDNAHDIRDMALFTTLPHTEAESRDYITKTNQVLEKRIADNNVLLKQLDKALRLKHSRELFDNLNNVRPAYSQALRKVMSVSAAGQYDAARALVISEVVGPQARVLDALSEMISDHSGSTVGMARGYVEEAHFAGNLLLIITIISAVIGSLIAWSIGRAVKGQLGGEPVYAVSVAKQVSEGQLNTAVELKQGDTRSLLAAMDEMRSRLLGVVREVRDSSHSISVGASEIAAGSTDLSQRTEEQAASLQETAASMEQMSQTIQQNAETVRTATRLANSASETATQSGNAVNNLVLTMREISESSQKIGDIISVIDGIAFQTNILALNAAVEAARAGESGRGFAVVAGEVRSLAQRSASAASEIKALIEDSMRTVTKGSDMVSSAGTTIDDLVQQSHRVAGLISEIGVTTEEQGQGIAQINVAITQLDQVTQQNAALVEESASAAESLSDQATRLVQLMSIFNTGQVIAAANARQDKPAPASTTRRPQLAANGGRLDNWEQF
ncbi:methyl-accepting chemotaxis protein [Enterobacter sp. Ap-916]|uniref:methyl-accepting chemotaxis protein n=1 Tax=Enterobacteriaceae TaxID=543 RepID=UPI0014245B40|nr:MULTISPECIES: methyl-accepting chemotaxis protein [unclassified Enterobacter]NIF58518.1 methyl-accepting chemotaxis protein [Enterobacter sp. Ap-867]NIG30322.1 methyl-accepting chemotaxis protein [Enterobacter sp. Ap-916]